MFAAGRPSVKDFPEIHKAIIKTSVVRMFRPLALTYRGRTGRFDCRRTLFVGAEPQVGVAWRNFYQPEA